MEPVRYDDKSIRTFMIFIDGSKKSFRCECGANVFHKPDKTDLNLYECNGCEARYRGNRGEEK